jgi:formylglycine-generating enzyme required for sulfatase activity
VNLPVGIEMVDIPPGRVELSDRRTRRSWWVDVRPYQLAIVQVTQSQYAQVAGTWPSETRGDRLPADSVSWIEAIRFCNALSERAGVTPAYHIGASGEDVDLIVSADGYRLPTEAEWEYACRAGTTGPRYGPLDEIAWHRGNSGDRVHEVGMKQPNAWGLHDMLGNIWEWCWDIYDPDVYGSYRVLRGGGWFDEHWSCRASVRRRSHPTLQLDDVGFRIARSAARC